MKLIFGLFFCVALLSGCPDAPPATVPQDAPLAASISVVIPDDASAALLLAANDFADATLEMTGRRAPILHSLSRARSPAIQVVRDSTIQGPQDYRLTRKSLGTKHYGIEVAAATDVGAMYGIYDVLGDLGVRYHHPEQTFVPSDPDARLPWDYDGTVESPRFELRGFHEHTQHPIPLSDFYLRPDPSHRPYVTNYLQWLARNRQNVASMHLLKTVDVDAWEPYIVDIIDEAQAYGIEIGAVVSFVDEQQNNYRLIDAYPSDDEDEQIRTSLTRLGELGFDFFTLPIASSEFTKAPDESIVRWIDTAANVAADLDPAPRLFTWIHISCDLRADDGSNYWHLPARASTEVGAWVHTVMFHDLEHPAPVYDCENFQHQLDFIEQEEGKRPLVYFPETAWWLGFDNNLPLALPITGWTRAYDINEALAGKDVMGHITFTSGREWNYWQYDHFLTRATWEGETTWSDYLEWIEPMYGERGPAVTTALEAFAERQVEDFLETNPLIYFYLAGELRQDEIGAQAGILARRPKLAYRDVVAFDDEAFAAWERDDYDLLTEMREAYAAILAELPAPADPDGSNLSDALYLELHASLDIFVKRIEHALLLYGAVKDARAWRVAFDAGAEEGSDEHEALLAAANEKLEAARAVSADVKATIHRMEAYYRYPDEFTIDPKPESPTVYPFGYLEEAHTAHFWTRRDDQLEALIDDVFFDRPDEWIQQPDEFYSAEGDAITLVEPDNALAADAILRFVPRMLFGATFAAGAQATLSVGQDANTNLIPDRGTEVQMPLDTSTPTWTATTDVYTLVVRNSVGVELGDGLSVFDPEFRFETESGVAQSATMRGHVTKANLIALIVDVGGIDPVGAERLLKTVFGIPTDEELPTLLPFEFAFELTAHGAE